MTTLLQTKAFHRIPPANLQAIFMRMNRTPYRAGEVVIKQGDEGDYFYAIVQGRCLVTRESPLNQKGIKLAELGVGETFGEEALIAEAKRNATVTMLTDGVLMRLNKQDFRDLMHEPLLRWVDEAQALKIIQNRGAVARRAAAVGIPEPGDRRFDQHPAVFRAPEVERTRSQDALRGGVRHRAAQLGRGVHSFGARLRCLRSEGRHHDVEPADAPAGLPDPDSSAHNARCLVRLLRLRAGVGVGAW